MGQAACAVVDSCNVGIAIINHHPFITIFMDINGWYTPSKMDGLLLLYPHYDVCNSETWEMSPSSNGDLSNKNGDRSIIYMVMQPLNRRGSNSSFGYTQICAAGVNAQHSDSCRIEDVQFCQGTKHDHVSSGEIYEASLSLFTTPFS